ncbi:putative ribonuclease H-like domain-containing protein [Tanacetum coccineum]
MSILARESSRETNSLLFDMQDYQDYDGGFVAFVGSSKGGRITGKGKLKTGKLDFEDVYFVKELKFSWVFFLAKKDETSGILKDFITGIENQLNHKVIIIRCDNGTKFKNYEMNQFCGIKGIKKEFSNARTPQQNGVAERKNKTLIEAARTITPIISFMRPFGCPVTILNTLDHLGKFDGKADEGFLVGYSVNSKPFRVFNSRTRKVEENLHVKFLKNKPNVAGNGSECLFDIDTLTNTMNYQLVNARNRTNGDAGLETNSDAGQGGKEKVLDQEYILLPLMHTSSNVSSSYEEDESSPKDDAGKNNGVKDPVKEGDINGPGEATNTNSTNRLNTVSSPVNTVSSSFITEDPGKARAQRNEFKNTGIFGNVYDDEDVGAEADINNLETTMSVSPISTTRIHKDRPNGQIIGEVDSAMEPKKVTQALDDESWVEAMQEELLQFKLLKLWTLVDLPHAQGHRQEEGIDYDKVFAPVARIEAIRLFFAYTSFMDFIVYQMDVKSAFLYGTIEEEVYFSQPPGFVDPKFPNRVYKAEKALYGLHQALKAWYKTLSTYLLENGFKRGTIDKTLFIKKIKNDILLVQVYVDDIIFGPTKKSLSTELEQLMHKIFQMSSMGELTFFLGLLVILAYASSMDFTVYQMDVKSAFLYGTIKEEVEQRKDGIFLSQDKYVSDILKKFGFFSVKTASTPMETHTPLSKDADVKDVDVHLYRSMIGSLMYLTSSRPDIMFAVCACSRFQVQPKASHMHAIKRIFRYLKGQPTLGLWYPKDSSLELIAYSDSDYTGASLDRKSTTRGCQFLGCRLISWQCKKQAIVANSTIEAEYIVASNCCGQVLWLQNQLLDYGYNFMHTKIHVDNEIEIRHHFIRDSYELIEMVKIHTDYNVADLLSKDFDVTRYRGLYTNENTATSKTINSVKQIHAIVDGKAVVISESSVRSDLLFNDEDGVTCLTNDEIFENLALMGYEQLSTKLTFQKGDASKWGGEIISDKIKPMFTNKDFEELDDHMENVEEETVDAATTGVSTAVVTISTAELRTPPSSTTVFDDEDVTMAMA